MVAPPVFDPSGFFDGTDLDRLMMADAQTGAEGVYRHSHWSVSFAEGTVEPLRLLASLHEGMHATLNDCTAYGSLLHVYAHLLRNDVEPANTRRLLGGLVQRTRTAHEAFATFASVVAVGEGSESPTPLRGYPLYRGYLQQAQALLVGLTGSFFRVAAANALFRLFLQPRAIARVADIGVEAFSLDQLDAADWPDQRFAAAKDIATPSFWKSITAELRTTLGNDPLWPVLEAHRRGDVDYKDTGSRAFDTLETTLIHHIYAAMARRFDDAGMASLPFDGHQPITAALIASTERLLPPGAVRYPLLAAGSDALEQDAVNRDTIVRFADEQYAIRPDRLKARLAPNRPADMAWDRLASGPDTLPHLFVVARQAPRMLSQYRLDDQGREWLEGLGEEPVITVRRRTLTPSGAPMVEMVALCDPDELADLIERAADVALPVYANLSLATLALGRWRKTWLQPLRRLAGMTVLLDLSPFTHLDRWTLDDGLEVRYGFLGTEAEGRRHIVFAADVVGGGIPMLLAPCSDAVAKSIGFYIENFSPRPAAFHADTGFLKEGGGLAASICLGHVLREESRFDFHAAQAVAAADMLADPKNVGPGTLENAGS